MSAQVKRKRGQKAEEPGSSSGIESFDNIDLPPSPGEISLQWHDYGVDRVHFDESGDIEKLCASVRSEELPMRWINVDGLHPYVVNRLRQRYGIHTLAAEDVLKTSQRSKLEAFDDYLFIVVKLLTMSRGKLHQEQVSIFLFNDTLITLQETKGDVWDPIRKRLRNKGSRLRSMGPAYLLYALLDAVVDHKFPLLEGFGESLEKMERAVIKDPQPRIQRKIHRITRDLRALRRVLWPLREVITELRRAETETIPEDVKTFMRDVHDHALQAMEIIESYREQAGGLNELYMSAVSNRMNEIMKVLTIMASFFIPVTFIAGVYGMNFKHFPELAWQHSYAGFWVICLSIFMGLFIYFRRKGWLGGNG